MELEALSFASDKVFTDTLPECDTFTNKVELSYGAIQLHYNSYETYTRSV